ncbi:MAG: carboxymuconolactone decarboxylase family protein [Acidimicrobiales bacterium]
MDRHTRERELQEQGRALRAEIPEVYQGFAQLHRAAYSDGEVSSKHKELIALGIAISDQCDGCIDSHVRAAHRRGASRQEIVETIGVAIAMMGGPGTVWGPRAFASYLACLDKNEAPESS